VCVLCVCSVCVYRVCVLCVFVLCVLRAGDVGVLYVCLRVFAPIVELTYTSFR